MMTAPPPRRRFKDDSKPIADRTVRLAIERYSVNYARLARNYALLGCDDKGIADLLKVTLSDLRVWELEFPEFGRMIDEGRAHADAEVAIAAFRSAKGYTHAIEKVFTHKMGKDSDERIEVTRVTVNERVLPVQKAQEFWLTNRQPELWKNRVDQRLDAKVTTEDVGLSGLLALAETARLAREERRALAAPTIDAEGATAVSSEG